MPGNQSLKVALILVLFLTAAFTLFHLFLQPNASSTPVVPPESTYKSQTNQNATPDTPKGEELNYSDMDTPQKKYIDRMNRAISDTSLMRNEKELTRLLPTQKPFNASFISEDYFQEALKDKTGKNLCFFTIVDKTFLGMVPLFVYSALESHPESRVIVRSTAPVEELNKKLNEVKFLQERKEHWSVEESSFLRSMKQNRDMGRASVSAAMRFLWREPALESCKFIYYSDADMFIRANPQGKTVLRWHAEKIQASLLPYDNVFRVPPSSIDKRDHQCHNLEEYYRFTGLHFIVTEPFFSSTAQSWKWINSLIERDIPKSWCCGHGFCDEHMLYLLIRLAGLPGDEPRPLPGNRPIHGLHIHRSVEASKEEADPRDVDVYCEHLKLQPEIMRGDLTSHARLSYLLQPISHFHEAIGTLSHLYRCPIRDLVLFRCFENMRKRYYDPYVKYCEQKSKA